MVANEIAQPDQLAWDPVSETVIWADYGLAQLKRYSFWDGQTSVVLNDSFLEPTRAVAAPHSGKIYWTCQGICRANVDGTGLEHVLDGGWIPLVGIDEAAGHLFVVSPHTAIERTDLQGKYLETLVTANWIYAATVDAVGGYLYWAEYTSQQELHVRRVSLAGGAPELLVNLGDEFVSSMALDPIESRLYWSTATRIQRVVLGKDDVEDFGPPIAGYAAGMVFTPGGLVWIDSTQNRLLALDSNGTEYLLVEGQWAGEGEIAVNEVSGHLFVSDRNGLQRRRSDGSALEFIAQMPLLRNLVVDAVAERVFGIDENSIVAVDLSSGTAGQLHTSPAGTNLTALYLDARGRKVYWTEQVADHSEPISTKRADFNGENQEDWPCYHKYAPNQMAVHPVEAMVFSDTEHQGGPSKERGIRRFGQVCGTLDEVIAHDQEAIGGIALDLRRDRVYWSFLSDPPRYIRTAALDGSFQELLPIEFSFPTNLAIASCDRNEGVQLEDYALFSLCSAGPAAEVIHFCRCADFSGDVLIDLIDYAVFQRAYNGSQP